MLSPNFAAILLLFAFSTQFSAAISPELKIDVHQMAQLKFWDSAANEQLFIISIEPIMEAKNTKLLLAHPLKMSNLFGQWVDTNKIENNYLVIKNVNGGGEEEWRFRNELNLLKEIVRKERLKTLGKPLMRHLVLPIQFGNCHLDCVGIVAVYNSFDFLGTREFGKEMKEKIVKNEKLNEMAISELIMEMAEAVRELDQVLVHMDLRPSNFIYVNDPIEGKILKIIGLGQSKLVEEKLFKNGGRIDGKSEMNGVQISAYSSPELDLAKKHAKVVDPISTKSDIWSMGIMTIEAILGKELKKGNEEMEMEKISEIFKLDWKNGGGELLAEYSPYLLGILQIRQKFPRIYLLILSMLEWNPSLRPSASEIYDFLWGIKNEIRQEIELNKLNYLTSKLTLENLTEIIKERKEKIGKEIEEIKSKIELNKSRQYMRALKGLNREKEELDEQIVVKEEERRTIEKIKTELIGI